MPGHTLSNSKALLKNVCGSRQILYGMGIFFVITAVGFVIVHELWLKCYSEDNAQRTLRTARVRRHLPDDNDHTRSSSRVNLTEPAAPRGRVYNHRVLKAIAADIKKDMDTSIHPCENFYEFACGNFLSSRTEDGKEHWKLNNNYFYMEQSDVIYENMIVEVKKIMEQLVDPLKDRKYVQNLKIAYNICKEKGLGAEKSSRKCALEIYEKLNLAAEFLFISKIDQEINRRDFHSLIHYVTQPLMASYDKAGLVNISELHDTLRRACEMSRISTGFYSFFLNEAIIENATILINGSDWTHVEAYAQVLRQTLKDNRDYRDNKYPSLLASLKFHDTTELKKSIVTIITHVLWGMLQGVFYNPNAPNYMNYGALGSEIARYQFERLQKTVRYYSYNTVYSDSYKKMTISNDCIHGGLASFFKQVLHEGTPPFLLVNTKLSTGTPFNGIYSYKMAYLGYKKWVEDNGAEPQLTIGGKSYTPDQLFWINAARARCLAINPNNRINVTHYIERIPREYEINQYFLHLEEFSKAFHCSSNASFKMNPKNRVCDIPV